MSVSTSPVATDRPAEAPIRPEPGAGGHMERRRRPRSAREWLLSLLPLAVAAVAFVVRLIDLVRANDVFIDELLYSRFAVQVAHGAFPNEGGRPFLLHPPGSLMLNGLVAKAFGISGTPIQLVLQLRWSNAVLGALTVALVFVLIRRVVGLPYALAGAALITFDPFVLRNNGRVMIETPAVFWLLLGWLVLLSTDEARSELRVRRGELWAGLFFGLALVTKDMTFVPAVGSLFAAAIWRQTLPWRSAIRMGLLSLVPYCFFLAYLTGAGAIPLWLHDKASGALRMLGIHQETGFNAVRVSLSSRLLDQLPHFGTSYLLLALAVPAALVAMFSSDRRQRILGVVGLCTGAMGSYAAIGGAAEEQFGYYVVLTAVPCLAIAVQMLIRRGRLVRRTVLTLAAGFLLATVALGVLSRTVTDDAYPATAAWMATHLPPSADVAVTGVTGEYAFPGDDVSPTLPELLANGNDYVLTSSRPLEEGYGYAPPSLLHWLRLNAQPVFTFSGPSNGDTVVWHLDRRALTAGLSGRTGPPGAP